MSGIRETVLKNMESAFALPVCRDICSSERGLGRRVDDSGALKIHLACIEDSNPNSSDEYSSAPMDMDANPLASRRQMCQSHNRSVSSV